MPHLQGNPEDLVFSVRTAGDPANVLSAVRAAVSAADPNIPILTIETQISTIERRFAQEKVLAQAYTLFGGIALFVAAIGLFGLMSYNVSRRTREIGIRMAMGAQRKEVLSLVLRESMLLVDRRHCDRHRRRARRRSLRRVAAVRPRADRPHDDDGSDSGDACGVGRGRVSARPPRHTRRSDGGAEVRIENW